MQPQLLTDSRKDRVLSPFVEMGAYEALWARTKTSFKSIADLVRDSRDIALSTFVSEAESDDYARKALAQLRSRGISDFGVHVRADASYPPKLLDADHPIELLYYRGHWDLIYTPSVAVVGTRNPTNEGEKRAHRIARLLVEDGYTVVSGLAAGIDRAAHSGAIAAGGDTIAVIGTPIDQNYPKQNEELQERIASEHLLLSQVPIVRYSRQGPSGNRLFFPERNITMAAITKATVIVEAGETSGTLIQARAAIKQGRKLFILESCFQNPKLSWPAKYEAMGAIRVREYSDIQRELGSAQKSVTD